MVCKRRIIGCCDFCGVCVPKEVCVLRCSRSLLWWCVCNMDFDCIVDTQWFLETGSSSWDKSEPI